MVDVVFRQEALEDLMSISQFIASHDPAAADRVIARIHHVIYRTLSSFPKSGRFNRRTGAREFAVAGLPYLIIYVPQDGLIDIVAVFHTSRDPAKKRNP